MTQHAEQGFLVRETREPDVMETQLVSVVVPTFRRPALLARTLASLQAQTYHNFHALICDNANDPTTREVVEALRDSRFTYLARPENLGMHRNAIDGFRRAEGDLVFKLDDDDLLMPGFLATMTRAFDDPAVTVAFCAIDLIDADDVFLPQQTLALARRSGRTGLRRGRFQPFAALAASGAIQLAGALVRREAVNWSRFPEPTGTAYDLAILLEAAENGAAAVYVDEPLVRYRMHPGSDSANKLAEQLTGGVHALESALGNGRHTETGELSGRLHDHLIRQARELMIVRDAVQARTSLRQAHQMRRTLTTTRLLALSYAPASFQARLMQRLKDRVVDETRLNAHTA